MGISFAVQRPLRLIRDLVVDRERPDLPKLAGIRDAQAFVWAILPHAARTFSASIAMLPQPLAEASAVAYLYCRMLDTYEDLLAGPEERDGALATFADRLATGGAPAPITPGLARDARDEAHLLLVRQCALVDEAYACLSADVQSLIRILVRDMAEGMRWSSAVFEAQDGVLENEDQLLRYCRNVLGGPVLFSARLLAWHQARDATLPKAVEEDAQAVGELIQLANVTRDIEKDLVRGVAYHPSLRGDLGAPVPDDDARTERIRAARSTLMSLALRRAPAYRRLVDHLGTPRFSMARSSAALMLLFTDRYYRGCATRAGRQAWGRRRSSASLMLTALPAAVSRRWTKRVLARIEGDFLAAASTHGG